MENVYEILDILINEYAKSNLLIRQVYLDKNVYQCLCYVDTGLPIAIIVSDDLRDILEPVNKSA